MAQLAAVLGALAAPLMLATARRETVFAGLGALAIAVALLAASSDGITSPARAGLVALGLVVAGAGALVFVRYPGVVPVLILVAAPFRPPLDFGAEHRFYVALARGGQAGRLLPLYAVLAAAALALGYRLVRGAEVRPLPRELAWPVAAFVSYASLSYLWAEAEAPAAQLLEYFLLPFVALVAVVAYAPVETWLPRVLAIVAVALASLFAVVGLVEEATQRLIFYTPSVEIGNAYSSFFRVTSLFRDPSLYGRHVVLGLAVVVVLLWSRRIGTALAAAIVALLFAGLFFSYSQSSLTALFAVVLAVAVAAGDRLVRIAAVGIAVVLVASGGAFVGSRVASASTERITSDRSRRIELTARVIRDHPLVGVGLGSQPRASQRLSDRGGPPALYVSHTTPLTVAAELGVIGLLLYLLVVAGEGLALVRLYRLDRWLGLTLAAVLLGLFVHSLSYSGFFEDPLTWLVFGLTAAFLGARTARDAGS
jgi:O-antigen ligase/polysaccharide polymerase Wzy-like membrane protein